MFDQQVYVEVAAGHQSRLGGFDARCPYQAPTYASFGKVWTIRTSRLLHDKVSSRRFRGVLPAPPCFRSSSFPLGGFTHVKHNKT